MKMKDTAQVALRMPDELKSQVKNAATREGRSMNSQIVQHLRTIYQDTDDQRGAA